MTKIVLVSARQVFDSRGTPTVEAAVTLGHGGTGSFICPSGASVGKKEAVELRDKDPKRYLGRGVTTALNHVKNTIAPAIVGREFGSQQELDRLLIDLDGTPNKSRLGANGLLAVSGAFFRALAAEQKRPLYTMADQQARHLLPLPLVNVINGGAHANNSLCIQEFMLVPSGAPTFSEAMRYAAETFYALKALLHKQGISTAVGDEGGFAPSLCATKDALDLLLQSIEHAGFTPGKDIKIALDCAASEYFDEAKQVYIFDQQNLSTTQLAARYEELISAYPICSIEDPFHEDDHEGFKALTKAVGSRVQVVGDDLFCTYRRYIEHGIENRLANAVLIKVNQIGTISETLDAVALTQGARFNAIISHRSGDSEDTTIADIAVLTRAGQIKTGSMSRSERLAKYNRLLRIEDELGNKAEFSPWCC